MTKAENASQKLWERIQKIAKDQGCTCGLRKLKAGQTVDDLRKYGGGCTDKRAPGHTPGGSRRLYVCPALDAYRRSAPKAKVEEVAA